MTSFLTVQNIKIKGVAAGRTHALAWDHEGFIYSWGDASYGKLGHPVDKDIIYGEEVLPRVVSHEISKPDFQIKALENERIVQGACGEKHSIALTNSGEIYMWGKTEGYEQESNLKKEETLSFVIS